MVEDVEEEESITVHANGTNGTSGPHHPSLMKAIPCDEEPKKRCLWFEEELEEQLRWVFGVSKYLNCHLLIFACNEKGTEALLLCIGRPALTWCVSVRECPGFTVNVHT